MTFATNKPVSQHLRQVRNQAGVAGLLYLDTTGNEFLLPNPPSDGAAYVLTCRDGVLAWETEATIAATISEAGDRLTEGGVPLFE